MSFNNQAIKLNSNKTFKDLPNDFIKSCKAIFSESQCIFDNLKLERYSKDCGLFASKQNGVIFAESTSDVQRVLQLCQNYSVTVHPISCGKNWGYGSASAANSGGIILDLSRMNQIRKFDRELAYVVIEPGVTQQQLYDFLQSEAQELCMDVTGSSAYSSIIGNLSERGYGQTPYGDRFTHSSGLEVVLPDGKLINTSFGHFKNSKTANLYKWGIGPYLDGLFTQSSMGVITAAGIWLMPKPEATDLLMIQADSDTAVAKLIPKLRDLKLRGLLPSTVHISNDIRVASCFQRIPEGCLDEQRSLSFAERSEIRKRYNLSAWNCFTSLRGSKRLVAITAQEIKKAIIGFAAVKHTTQRSIALARKFGPAYCFFAGIQYEKVDLLDRLIRGVPSEGAVNGAYWRSAIAPSSKIPDPVKDNVGLIWCAPVIPSTENDTKQFLSFVSDCMSEFGFESNITLTMLSDRALCCTIAVAFNRANEEKRASECYHQLLKGLVSQGYIPYRHGINIESTRDILFTKDDQFWNTCRDIKQLLDPKLVLSPSKYGLF